MKQENREKLKEILELNIFIGFEGRIDNLIHEVLDSEDYEK